MKTKKQNGPSFKQRMKRLRKKSSDGLYQTKEGIKKGLNINRYNKMLFIFETILLVGVIDEFLEIQILKLDFGLYVNIALLMVTLGILFYFAFHIVEKAAKSTIVWIVRLNNNKILRFLVHVIILSFLYYLYAKIFFSTTIGLTFNLGLNAS